MEMQATPPFNENEVIFGEKVCNWLLEKLDSQDRLSFKTKNKIKEDIKLYKALKEIPDATEDAQVAAKKLLLQLKDHTFLIQGGKAMIKLGETQLASAMLGYEFPVLPIRPYVKVVNYTGKGTSKKKSSRGGSAQGSGAKSRRAK
jgi:hypothetical protein